MPLHNIHENIDSYASEDPASSAPDSDSSVSKESDSLVLKHDNERE
jgi:hypothetical protein